MPKMALSHFEVTLIFALCTSIVMGITTKKTEREQIHYAIYCFVCFIGAVFVLSWLMYFGHG